MSSGPSSRSFGTSHRRTTTCTFRYVDLFYVSCTSKQYQFQEFTRVYDAPFESAFEPDEEHRIPCSNLHVGDLVTVYFQVHRGKRVSFILHYIVRVYEYCAVQMRYIPDTIDDMEFVTSRLHTL